MTRKSSTWNKKPTGLKFHAEGRRAIEAGIKTETRRLVKADNSRVYPGKFYGVDLESGRRVELLAGDAIRARCRFGSGRIRSVTIEPQFRPGALVRMAGGRTVKKGPAPIVLEIVAVRASRLQDLTDADVLAEGIGHDGHVAPGGLRELFGQRVDKIYGPGTWAANPWVWVYVFRKMERTKA